MGILDSYRSAVAASRKRRDAAKKLACERCSRECAELADVKKRALRQQRSGGGQRSMPPAYARAWRSAVARVADYKLRHPGAEVFEPGEVGSSGVTQDLLRDTRARGGGGASAFRYRLLVGAGVPESAIRGKRPPGY